MGNPVVHWELMSKDPAGVSEFYAKLFGWKVTHHPQINYRVVETGAKGAMGLWKAAAPTKGKPKAKPKKAAKKKK